MFDLSTLDHTDVQIGELRQTFDAVVRSKENKPYDFVREYDTKASQVVLRIKVLKRLPPSWPSLIGQCVSGVRDPLDHIIYALSEKGAGRPLAGREPRTVLFPIYDDPDDFNATGRRAIRFLDPAAKVAVEDMQPYNRPDRTNYKPLFLLNELANVKKHRYPLTGSITTQSSIAIQTIQGFDVDFAHLGLRNGAFVNGDEIARFHARPTAANAKLEMHVYLAFDIAFGEKGPAAGLPVVDTLKEVSNIVRNDVIPKLSTFL